MTVWDDTIVRLDEHELLLAATEAHRRWAIHEAAASRDRGGVARDLNKDIAGVCGEIAAAKWTGRYWTAGKRANADVADALETRCRRSNPRDERPMLLIQPYDEEKRPTFPFILVVGQRNEYRIVGWITPARARHLHELGAVQIADPGNRGAPCLAVPQNALAPADEFKAPPIALEAPWT